MKLPTLYSRSSTGALLHWTVEHNDTAYRTHSGQVGGKTTTSKWYEVEATNVGRANERDQAAQAEFEARAKWQKKADAGGTPDRECVDTSVLFIEPMLAKKWEDRKGKTVYPLYSQPKLDGMRAIITKDGARSRTGKAWVTIPHILRALAPVFEAHPDLVLDGELYNHTFKHDFNKISSLAKKTVPTAEDLLESERLLEFHVYDIADPKTRTSGRMQTLKDLFTWFPPSSVRLVETTLVENEAELDEVYSGYVEAGYEGQMVRTDEPYEFKRSSSLLKRKEFQDAEYRIVEVIEGKGNKTGLAARMTLAREDGVLFGSNIKGSFQFLEEVLKKKDSLPGSFATVAYFNLTPDGIPRFPYVTRLRDGVGED